MQVLDSWWQMYLVFLLFGQAERKEKLYRLPLEAGRQPYFFYYSSGRRTGSLLWTTPWHRFSFDTTWYFRCFSWSPSWRWPKIGISSSPSRDEIRTTLFSIDGDKAPGPNGYSSKFFKTTWHITGDHFVAAVSKFFTTGHLLKAWNHAIIALTPKTNHSPTVSDFRLISCCSVFYKVVAKILANQLSSVLDGLIDCSQAVFIPSQHMSDISTYCNSSCVTIIASEFLQDVLST